MPLRSVHPAATFTRRPAPTRAGRPALPRSLGALCLFSILAAACADTPRSEEREGAGEQESELSSAPGALIRMHMDSTVGVLLDEIPAGPQRNSAATWALSRSHSFWEERAARQTRLTYYRLMYRGYFTDEPKGPLPLPASRDLWDIELVGAPHRVKRKGHDAIVVDYVFRSYIVTDRDSPALVEPALAQVGGKWDEHFHLPLDPELLFERTGYACMDEAEYPPRSVFEENTHYFYDDTCEVEWPEMSACHVTAFPEESCVDALAAHTGLEKVKMRFKRVAYNPWLAGAYRTGTVTNPTGADLAVIRGDVEEENRIIYRYFEPGSCEEQEGVITQPGWRRLLTFSASIQNDGTGPVHVGSLLDPDGPWLASHVYEFSACHGHYHFSHYGDFGYSDAPGAKRAFCLQDTNRYHNDELTPLTPDHQSCVYQGVSPGWGDEYQFGIPGQWVDITDVNASVPHDLTFDLNPQHFLCEGTPELDAAGDPIFDPTGFTDAAGNTVSRLRCDLAPGWQDNNHAAVPVTSAVGSFVTEPCTRGQIGPLRSCGFDPEPSLHTCIPGAPVSLQCSTSGSPQVLRACERSEALGTGVACTVADSLANTVVKGNGVNVTFPCPAVRDAAATATGGYSLYGAPLLPWQPTSPITCTPN